MESMESRLDTIPVKVQINNGTIIRLEVVSTGREDVAINIRPFEEVTDALEGIVQTLAGVLQKVAPTKASVKFGVEVALEAGHLTAVIVKGSGKANLDITLEWSK
jgi:hypothetical protein